MDEHETMRIEYRLRPEDFREEVLAQADSPEFIAMTKIARRAVVLRSLLLFPAWPFAFVGVEAAMSTTGSGFFGSFTNAFITGCVISGINLWSAFSHVNNSQKRRNTLRANADQLTFPGFIGRSVCTIGPEGVGYECRYPSSIFRWSDVQELKIDRRRLLIELSSGRDINIPAGSVETGQSFNDIKAHVAKYWDEDAAAAALANDVLADHTCPCAGCGYTMSGIKNGVCPECGRPVRYKDLKRIQSLPDQASTASGLTPDSSSTRSA